MSPDLSSVRTGVHPTPPPKKHERDRKRGPTVQIKAAHNDSYLHTFRSYKHLHIQKYSAIFPCLLPRVRLCAFACAPVRRQARAHVAAMCRTGRHNSSAVCQSASVTCVTHGPSVKRDSGLRDRLRPCVAT